jgi:hypothetical protein
MVAGRNAPNRGQILLISSLIMAVVFVGLAVAVNSAIYAENQATREVTRSSEPLADHPVTEERLSRAFDDVNHDNDTATYGPRTRNLNDNVTGWDSTMQGKESAEGTLFGSRIVDTNNGTRISQDTPRDFQPHSDAYDGSDLDTDTLDPLADTLDPAGLTDRNSWRMAFDVRSRGYEATVQRSSLIEVDVDLGDLVSFLLDGNDPFGVVFNETASDFRTVYLVNDSSGGTSEVAAVVTKSNATSEEYVGHCSVEAATATVRLDDNELEGGGGTVVDCPALSVTNGLGRHDIHYVGSDNVLGTYDVIVDRRKSPFDADIEDKYTESFLDSVLGLCLLGCDTTVYEAPGSGQPYTTWAVWNSTVELTYTDSRVHVTRNMTVPREG